MKKVVNCTELAIYNAKMVTFNGVTEWKNACKLSAQRDKMRLQFDRTSMNGTDSRQATVTEYSIIYGAENCLLLPEQFQRLKQRRRLDAINSAETDADRQRRVEQRRDAEQRRQTATDEKAIYNRQKETIWKNSTEQTQTDSAETAQTIHPKYNALAQWRTEYRQRRDTAPRHRTAWHIVAVTPIDTAPITETAATYILDVVAPRMAYTAVKQIFVKGRDIKEGDGWKKQGRDSSSYMFDLMRQAQDDRRRREYGNNVDILSSEYYTDKDGKTDARTTATQERKVHKKAKINGLMVEIMPYETLELTDSGRKRAQTDTGTTTEFSDCIGVAVEKLIELCNEGLINNYSDVWQLRRYVYRAVNKYVQQQRKHRAETDRFADNCIIYDAETDTEQIYTGKAIDKRLQGVSRQDILETIESVIRQKADKRMNIDNIIKVLYFIGAGYTQKQIAESMNMTQQRIAVIKGYIVKFLDDEDIKEQLFSMI